MRIINSNLREHPSTFSYESSGMLHNCSLEAAIYFSRVFFAILLLRYDARFLVPRRYARGI